MDTMIKTEDGQLMDISQLDNVKFINLVHLLNTKTDIPRKLLDIPDEYQLDSKAIRKYLYNNPNPFPHLAREVSVILLAYSKDSVLSISNDVLSKSTTIEPIHEYIVLAVGDKVTDLRVGDKVEFVPSRALRVSLDDSFSRESIAASLRKIPNSQLNILVQRPEKLTYQTVYACYAIDVYLIHDRNVE